MSTSGEHNLALSLAQRVIEIRTATLSDDAVRKVRQHLLDGMASAFIGCRSAVFADIAAGILPKWGGVLPRGEDSAMAWAFAINGSVSEDGSREGACHPAAVVVPVIVAFGEGKSPETIDRAMVAGYDVMIRLARAGNPHFARKGFHGTAVTAPFGAAATLAQLRGYDLATTSQALCLAALGGSGLMAAFKNGSTQPLQVGWGVRNGVDAALLAEKGHGGYGNVLEEGFFPAYLEKGLHESVMAPLEKEYAIEGCYLKPYPGCRHMHASLEAFSSIVERHGIGHGEIEAVRVGTYRIALETGIKNVKKRGDAYFNIPYAIAARAVLGAATYDSFDEKHFADPDIVRMTRLVTECVDPDIESRYPGQRGSRVEVELADGRTFSHSVSYPLGEPEAPLSLAVTRDKFVSCTDGYLSDGERADILRRMEGRSGEPAGPDICEVLSRRLFCNR